MILPMLRLMANQPELLAEHASAYAELTVVELGRISSALARRSLLHVTAICFLGVATALVGVAAMLMIVLPDGQVLHPWILTLVPVPPLLLALCCWWLARAHANLDAFETVRLQMKADAAMLREVSAACN